MQKESNELEALESSVVASYADFAAMADALATLSAACSALSAKQRTRENPRTANKAHRKTVV